MEILGRKIAMTQIFSKNGKRIPVTVIKTGPCVIVRKKSPEKDGYSALQVGYEEIPPSRKTKPILGNMKAAGTRAFRILREVKVENSNDELGKELTVGMFKEGDILTITGRSKGKGFAGVVKRHHFAGGVASHGSMFHRAPGSLGTHTYPGRTIKGKRLMGHMGNVRVTIKRVKVVHVDEAKNLLIVKGPVPGARHSLLLLNKSNG